MPFADEMVEVAERKTSPDNFGVGRDLKLDEIAQDQIGRHCLCLPQRIVNGVSAIPIRIVKGTVWGCAK